MDTPLIEVLILKIKDLDKLKERIENDGSGFLNSRWDKEKSKDSEFDYWRGAHCQVDDEKGIREKAMKEKIKNIKSKDPGFIPVGEYRDVFAKTKYPEALSGLLFVIFRDISNKDLLDDWVKYVAIVRDDLTQRISMSCSMVLKENSLNDPNSFTIRIVEDVINFIYESIDFLKNKRDFDQPINEKDIN